MKIKKILAQFSLVLSLIFSAHAHAFIVQTGQEIFTVKFSPDFGKGEELGYVCQYLGILGADVYKWNCKLMVVSVKESTVQELYYHEKLRYEREYPQTSITRTFWQQFGFWIMLFSGGSYFFAAKYPQQCASVWQGLIAFYKNASQSLLVRAWKKSSFTFKFHAILILAVGLTVCIKLITYKTPWEKHLEAQRNHDPKVYGDARFRTARVSSNDTDITPDRHDELEAHLVRAEESFISRGMSAQEIQTALYALRLKDCHEVANAASYYSEPRPEINRYLIDYCNPQMLMQNQAK